MKDMEAGKRSSMTREKVKLLEAAGEFLHDYRLCTEHCYQRTLLTHSDLHDLIKRISMGEAKRNPR